MTKTSKWLRTATMVAGAMLFASQGALAQSADRDGKEVFDAVCSKCHATGVRGAPKIGDREAWNPRLKNGIDSAVRSAIRGHGGMPPRGKKADLTDVEVRNAITYMINPTAPAKGAEPTAAPVRPGAQSKTVAGTEVYLGFVSADTLRKAPEGSVERTMHGGVPSGSGYYHVNISLLDAESKQAIPNAKVEVRVEQLGMSGDTKTLEPVKAGGIDSYGNYFRLMPKTQYTVIVRFRRPGAPQPVETRFDYRTY